METNLLDRMLATYREGRTTITVTLQNRIRISGRIAAFDSYVIIIEGQRREIIYRHAVASVAAGAGDEGKRSPAPARPDQQNARPKHAAPARSRPAPSVQASSGQTGLNTGMKEGLLKWMQEQKAAK